VDFADALRRNLDAVRLTKDGGLEAPVRANPRDGLVVGQDAVDQAEAARAAEPADTSKPGTKRSHRRWLGRRD
jgi:hypothetical protein